MLIASQCGTVQETTQEISIAVRVYGLLSEVQSLKVAATLDGALDVSGGVSFVRGAKELSLFKIVLPQDVPRPSNVVINATGLADDLCKLAEGQAEVALKSGVYVYETSLTLSLWPQKMCMLDVDVTGDGAVTSQPAGISCGSYCSVSLPFGSVVKLTADRNVSRSIAAEWSIDCAEGAIPASGVCTFTLTGERTVRVRLVPRQCRDSGWCWYNPIPASESLADVWASEPHDI